MLSFEVAGEQQLSMAVTRVTRGVDDMRPLWEMFRTSFIEQEQHTFDAGTGWPPLSPTYAAWKAAHYGTPPLVLTGALRDSLTGGGGFVYRAAPKSLAIGSEVPYGGYHQTGTSKMPARKPIQMDELFGRVWARDAGRYLQRIGAMWSSGRPFALS